MRKGAGETVDEKEEGIGSFQIRLLDALSLKMEMVRGRRMEVQSRMKQNKKRYISPEQLRLYAVDRQKRASQKARHWETVVETHGAFRRDVCTAPGETRFG